MKEFSNIVEIYLTSQVEKIENKQLTPKANQNPITVHASDFDIAPTPRQAKAGVLSEINFVLNIDPLSDTDVSTLSFERSVVLVFKTSHGTDLIVGSLQYPTKVFISQQLNADILYVKSVQPKPHRL